MNSATDGDFSGTVLSYNFGFVFSSFCHFTISPFRHFTILLFRHFSRYFVISPFRVLNTPLETDWNLRHFIGLGKLIGKGFQIVNRGKTSKV